LPRNTTTTTTNIKFHFVNSMIVVVVSKPFGTRISLAKKKKKRKQKKERKKERKKKEKRSNQVVCTILTRFVSLSNYPTVATTCVFQLTRHL